MKKYGLVAIGTMFIVLTAHSCRDRQANDPERDVLEEVEQGKQEHMDRYREWSGSEVRDSMAQKRDSILRDSLQRDSIHLDP